MKERDGICHTKIKHKYSNNTTELKGKWGKYLQK